MPPKSRKAAICDANVLIDYADSDEDIIRELVRYWGKVYVPTRVLHEVKRLPQARAEELGLTIIETPLVLPPASSLSGPDRACLHFVIAEGWVCIANDKALRKECLRRGGTVVWGLEMLIKLVEATQITEARAIDIATHIQMINPEIPEAFLADFKAMLSKR